MLRELHRHFYQPLRPLEVIRSDILSLEQETEGLLAEIIGTSDSKERIR